MKRKGDALSGILVLDKASGLGSTQAVAKLKYLLQVQKAGHGGTLDPLASGVLPILFGEATKLAADLLDADKAYEATIALGTTTDSADAAGNVTATAPVTCTANDIERVCVSFRGPISQIPPMYSALKKDGKPLYEYARAGVEFELAARAVTIHELTILEICLPAGDDPVDGQQAFVKVFVRCSKGTYIRSLARDIGDRLGCGAHLSALRRTQAGSLGLSETVSVTTLMDETLQERRARLLPIDRLLQTLPRFDLTDTDSKRFCMGQRIALNPLNHALENATETIEKIRIYQQSTQTLIGLAQLQNGVLHPTRVIVPETVAPMH